MGFEIGHSFFDQVCGIFVGTLVSRCKPATLHLTSTWPTTHRSPLVSPLGADRPQGCYGHQLMPIHLGDHALGGPGPVDDLPGVMAGLGLESDGGVA